ncbi:MAG: DUF4153 domain-containing protein [Intrasporangium sp.]|uniref:DUF4153 domain-containing protein n=1 Tax=Intrasporangium sp. TaxID=1925024 RepID=UPI003F7E3C5C
MATSVSEHPIDLDRPLEGLGSIKAKLGLLVGASIVVAALVSQVGDRAGVPPWLTVPVTIVAALGVTQWLARGMTAPLREMTRAATRMAGGDYRQRVTATSDDEVGRLARAFNAMADDIASADRQRRELVAMVSHEVRTPLAAQRALLENLADGVVREPEVALRRALAQSERLSDLVTDLLDLSRIEGGVVPLDLGLVAVAELLEHAVGEPSSRSQQVRVETTVEPADLVARADRARLVQVVMNLVDNAARHSPEGGVVRVRAGQARPGHWFLEVADDGPGIPLERSSDVFAPFGTLDRAGGGTGLGLAIARWVCELHGGSIDLVPTEPGASGTRVRADLPLEPPVPAGSPAPAAGVAPAIAPERAIPAAVPSGGPPVAVPDTEPDATGASSPSFVEGLFGPLWPERGLGPTRLALFGSLGIGLVGAVVLPYRPIGLAVLLVLLLSGALVLSVSPRRSRPWTVASAVLCLVLASLVVVRAAEWLVVLALFVVGFLVTTALTDARRIIAVIAGPVAWVLAGLRGLPLLRRTLAALSSHRLLWPVARTLAISVVALVVFGGLFATADPVVGTWATQLVPDLGWASVVLRVFVLVVVGGIVLAACYLAINPPPLDAVQLPEARRVTRSWEWLVPVGVVVLTFLVFVVAQASVMWGGHDYVRRTTGLTYADYVHQGFGQLTVATLLTLVTVAITVRKAPRRTARERLLLRLVLGALCVLALVVVASALFRMTVYQQAYGFTVLRLVVDAFEIWLGVLVVLVLLTFVRLQARWLPRAALVSAAVGVLVLGWMNPEAWVAQHNIDRYRSTGKLDTAYLSTLGPDATPTILSGLPPGLAACSVPNSEPTGDVLSWNLGRARASEARASGDQHTTTLVGCP